MKAGKATLALVAVLAGIMASEPVLAKGGGRGGGRSGGHSSGHSHGHRASHVRSVIVSGAVFWPGYYYSPFYAPSVAVQSEPWGYIEQGTDSYYCADNQKTYPNTLDCPGAWQLITPVPTPGS